MHGARDATMNWTKVYTDLALECGFEKDGSCPCNFHHPRGLAMTVHGDDFTLAGGTKDLWWFKGMFEAKFEITAKTLGPEEGQEREIHVLNRVLRWEAAGVIYEPKPKARRNGRP